jgi:TIGR02594 family protein
MTLCALSGTGWSQFLDEPSRIPSFEYPKGSDDSGPRKTVYPIPPVPVSSKPWGAVGPGVEVLIENPTGYLPAHPPSNGSSDTPPQPNNPPNPPTNQPPGGVSGTPWMQTASNEIGLHESNNARVREFHATTGLNAGGNTPWCSSFVNWVLAQHGIKGTNNAWAQSWANWGVDAGGPVVGSVVVFRWSSSTGHVGFVHSVNSDGSINVLGGNQRDSVRISRFNTSQIIGYRLPSGYSGGGVVTGDGSGEWGDFDSTR